ncbi:hypothetical protein TWF225_008060 [Orbilia oligospora]|uniref:Uncharacterized protein n=1 Tax=Orbilia oligospora TaxID=2813651 RepID=A0A7C8KBD9_ORBOL|nr:hypothetical protein TWF751_010572 [Orbilia oligospora]KAF3177783.1 hypothetical protein TWF225_008060 [Orbilia oligospora]KAF3239803.1 hypothetical protein TWF128_011687 [Orbilia oligospora]KAF3248001.1 hypothetical protein TWF217_009459 [Orbilia oligospora]TGJ67029.1 hypothetical protein EYR41_008614 [Orbilia oligospora]
MDMDPDLVGTLVRTYRFLSDVHKISWEDLPHPAFAIIPVVVIALGLKMENDDRCPTQTLFSQDLPSRSRARAPKWTESH